MSFITHPYHILTESKHAGEKVGKIYMIYFKDSFNVNWTTAKASKALRVDLYDMYEN